MDRRTRGDRIAEFFGSKRLVQVFRPLAEEIFRQGGSPEDLERIGGNQVLRQTLAGHIIGVPAPVFIAPEAKSERAWRKENGIIYLSVTSDGTTGPEWINRLVQKGFPLLSPQAKYLLCSSDFKPTSGVTIEIAILPGTLWNYNERITRVIRAEAAARKLLSPNAETACLIREMFSDEEMEAMWPRRIVTMHEPIKDSNGGPFLLGANCDGCGRWLLAYYGHPACWWSRDDGFAFAVSSSRNEIPSAGQV